MEKTSVCLVCNDTFLLPCSSNDFRRILYKLEDLKNVEHCFATNFGLTPEEISRASFLKPNMYPFCSECTPLVQNMVTLQATLTELENKLSCAKRGIARKIVDTYTYTVDDSPFFEMKNIIFEKWFHQLEQGREREEQLEKPEGEQMPMDGVQQSTEHNASNKKQAISREVAILKRKGKGDKMPISIDEEETEEVTCAICNKIYRSKAYLNLHMKTHTGETRPFGCHLCDKSFFALSLLKKHLKTRHDHDYVPPSEDDTLPEMKSEPDATPIDTSASVEVTKVTMADGQEAHLIIGRNVENEIETFTPVVYDDTPARTMELDDAGDGDTFEISSSFDSGEYFDAGGSLDSGDYFEAGDNFDMGINYDEFGQGQGFVPVYKNTISCQLCDKLFASKVTLTKHVRTVHLKTIKVQCPICRMTTRDHYNLAKHLLSHDTKLTKLIYNCPVCGLGFLLRKDFHQHYRRNHRLDSGYPKPIIRALEDHEDINITEIEKTTRISENSVNLTERNATPSNVDVIVPTPSPSQPITANAETLEETLYVEPTVENVGAENVVANETNVEMSERVADSEPQEVQAATALDSEAPAATTSESPAPTVLSSNSPAPTATVSDSPAQAATTSDSPAPTETTTYSPGHVATTSDAPAPTAATSDYPASPVATTKSRAPSANLKKRKRRKRRALTYMSRNRLLKNRMRLAAVAKQSHTPIDNQSATPIAATEVLTPISCNLNLSEESVSQSTASTNCENDQIIKSVPNSQATWQNLNFSCFLQIEKLETVMVAPEGEEEEPVPAAPETAETLPRPPKRKMNMCGPKSKLDEIRAKMLKSLETNEIPQPNPVIAPTPCAPSGVNLIQEKSTVNTIKKKFLPILPKPVLTTGQQLPAGEGTGVLQNSNGSTEKQMDKVNNEVRKSVPPISLTKVCLASKGSRREIWVTTRKDGNKKTPQKPLTVIDQGGQTLILKRILGSPKAATTGSIPALVPVSAHPATVTTNASVFNSQPPLLISKSSPLYDQLTSKRQLIPAKYPLPNKHLAQIAKSFKQRNRNYPRSRVTAVKPLNVKNPPQLTNFRQQSSKQQTTGNYSNAANGGPIIQSTHSLAGLSLQSRQNLAPRIAVSSPSPSTITQVSAERRPSSADRNITRPSSGGSTFQPQNSPHLQALLRNSNIAISLIGKEDSEETPLSSTTSSQPAGVQQFDSGIRLVQIEDVLKGAAQSQHNVPSLVPKRKFVLSNLKQRRSDIEKPATTMQTSTATALIATNSSQQRDSDVGLIKLRSLDSLLEVEAEDPGEDPFYNGYVLNNNRVTTLKAGPIEVTSIVAQSQPRTAAYRPFSRNESPIMRYSEHMRIQSQQRLTPQVPHLVQLQSFRNNVASFSIRPNTSLLAASSTPTNSAAPRTFILSSMLGQRNPTAQ